MRRGRSAEPSCSDQATVGPVGPEPERALGTRESTELNDHRGGEVDWGPPRGDELAELVLGEQGVRLSLRLIERLSSPLARGRRCVPGASGSARACRRVSHGRRGRAGSGSTTRHLDRDGLSTDRRIEARSRVERPAAASSAYRARAAANVPRRREASLPPRRRRASAWRGRPEGVEDRLVADRAATASSDAIAAAGASRRRVAPSIPVHPQPGSPPR